MLEWFRRRKPKPAQFVSDDEAAQFWTAPADRTFLAHWTSTKAKAVGGPPIVGADFWIRMRSWLRPVVGTLVEAIETDSGGCSVLFEITDEDAAFMYEHCESREDEPDA